MLEKTDEIDRIEVLSSGEIQIRQVTIIFDGGAEVSRSYNRWILHPSDDLSGQNDRVRRIAQAAWA